MKRLLLITFSLLAFVVCHAQTNRTDTIREMPAAIRTGQLLEQYVKTHSVSEMDGDTVDLVNIYSTIGYGFNDKYLGIVTQHFLVTMQDIEFEDSTAGAYKTMVYIPIKAGIYELTKFDEKEMERKLGYKFVLNGENNFFVRMDRFAVKAEYDYGKKHVTFHCLTYPKRYTFDFGKDKTQ